MTANVDAHCIAIIKKIINPTIVGPVKISSLEFKNVASFNNVLIDSVSVLTPKRINNIETNTSLAATTLKWPLHSPIYAHSLKTVQ